jgi:hypothetical protein
MHISVQRDAARTGNLNGRSRYDNFVSGPTKRWALTRQRLAMTTITRTIKVGSTSRYDRKHFIATSEVRQELDDGRAGNVASQRRGLAAGFVDFLLGRRARYDVDRHAPPVH